MLYHVLQVWICSVRLFLLRSLSPVGIDLALLLLFSFDHYYSGEWVLCVFDLPGFFKL